MSRTRNTADLVSLNAISATGGRVGIGTTARSNQFYVDGNTQIVGVVTASSFVGNLTGSASSLSGVSSSFLLDYNNFTNTPTIPTNNNQLTNGAGYITTSFTNTNQLTNGAGFITNSVTGDFSVSGNVSVGGTLTYEDVTNVDSIGIITAREGITVTGGISTFTDTNVGGLTTFFDHVHLKAHGGYKNIYFYASTGAWAGQLQYNQGSGDLNLSSAYKTTISANGDVIIKDGSYSYNRGIFKDTSVELYHSNSKKFETTGIGVTVFGTTETQQLNVSGVTTSSGGFVGDLTGDVTGIATGATKVYVDESEDDDAFYNIIFTDEDPGSGNSYHTMQVDNTGLTFNPGTNTLRVQQLESTGSTLNVNEELKVSSTLRVRADNSQFVIENGSGSNKFLVDTDNGNTEVMGTLDVDGVATFSAGISVTGEVGLDHGSVETITSTKTSTSEDSVDSFAAATYRSVSYDVQITRGSLYHTTTIKILHDGTNTYITEYGTINTGTSLASFSSDIDSGNVRLLATPTSATSTVFKIVRTLIKV